MCPNILKLSVTSALFLNRRYRSSFRVASCDLWIESLPTAGDPLNHTKQTRKRGRIFWHSGQPSLPEVALTVAAVCPASGVKCSARRASQVHRAREEVRNGIATAENRDSYADI